MLSYKKFVIVIFLIFGFYQSYGQDIEAIKKEIPSLISDYKYLHQNPELSFLEKNTADYLANKMRSLGYEVTENFGGTGIVAILKNGNGPKILIRTDMDALPIKEETGVAFASKKMQKDIEGIERPVMHACGHDMHMTVWLGTAQYLATHKNEWKGTLMMIGQPAEERGGGSDAMLKAGLYKKFFTPDVALALHVRSNKPAGSISYCPEYAMANVDMAQIKFSGIGGHGAYPHNTIDPIVMSAQFITDLQNIVSREIAPTDPAVITVGTIHGGTKGNIIPADVNLELTIRSYKDEVRNHLIKAIQRKAKAVAESFNVPKDRYPIFELKDTYTPALYNDPELTDKIVSSFKKYFGVEKIKKISPVMGGEDFGRFGKTKERVPVFMYFLGIANPQKYDDAKKNGTKLPSLHSSKVIPDIYPSILTGVSSMVNAVYTVLKTD